MAEPSGEGQPEEPPSTVTSPVKKCKGKSGKQEEEADGDDQSPQVPGWQLLDGSRKSAFLPYRAHTVLTNLQRGNIPTQVSGQSLEITEDAWSLHQRAGRGEVSDQELRSLGAHGREEREEESGLTPLMWACAYGQLPTAKLLVKYGANVNREGPGGETAILLAAAGGHHDLVRLLIEAGANMHRKDLSGNTALMFAAHGNHPHVVNELLIHGADLTAVNDEDYTAFDIAAANGSKSAQIVMEKYILQTSSEQDKNGAA